MDLCTCHSGPLSWCPTYRDRNVLTMAALPTVDGAVVGPDGIPHEPWVSADGMSYDLSECAVDCPGWHEGAVVPAPMPGVCGVCGGNFEDGDLVAKMPLPLYGYPYSHAVC
jgi:hypothetical protein